MPKSLTLTPPEFLSRLKQKSVSPVLLLLGEELYFHDQVVRALKETFLSEGVAEFSTFVYDLTQAKLEEVIDAASTHSLLAPIKIVVARDFDLLRENQVQDRDWAAMERYLANPNPQTHLVFHAEKLDRRKHLTKLIQENGWTIQCERLSSTAAKAWVCDRLLREAVGIDPHAVNELVEAVGNNLCLLEQEIQKLLSFVGGRRQVTRDDVELLLFRARVNSVFDLVDAINRKDRPQSLQILSNLFENEVEAPQVIFWLARLYRQLLILKDQKGRLDAWGIVRLLHVPKDFADRLAAQEKKFSREELCAGFTKLAGLDRRIKRLSIDDQTQCEFFVLDLISAPRGIPVS